MCLSSNKNDKARVSGFIHNHSVDTLVDIGPIDIETISFRRNNKIIHLEPSEEMLLRNQDVPNVSEELKIIRAKPNPVVKSDKQQKKSDKPQKKSDKQQSPSGDGDVDKGDINSTIKSTDQSPILEVCVTQGSGLTADDSINEMTDVNEEGSHGGANELNTSTTADESLTKKTMLNDEAPDFDDNSVSQISSEKAAKIPGNLHWNLFLLGFSFTINAI